MAGLFITTTKRSLLRPLASQGIFVTDCFYQIQAILEKISPEHKALLAEPVHTNDSTGSESIDWYANVNSDNVPKPLSSLPPQNRAEILQSIAKLAKDIEAKAASLSQSQRTEGQHALSGEILKLALQHPNDEDIWVVGTQPVVINWGFASGTVGAQPVDLARLGAAAAPIAVEPTPMPAAPVAAPVAAPIAAGSGCLGWLLPLFLLLLLLLLLLSSLGLIPFNLPTSCMPEVKIPAELDNAKAKENDLVSELEALRLQLFEKAELCKPEETIIEEPPAVEEPPIIEEPEIIEPVEPPLTEPPAIVEPETETETEQQAEPAIQEPFIAMTPEEEPEPEPKPEPKKQEPKQQEPKRQPEKEPKKDPKKQEKPKKDDPLQIPEDAKENNDMSFLEGCWRSETGLFNSRTGKPIIAEYCFDKNGQGRRLIREDDGSVCSGGVQAKFNNNGTLVMDGVQARCPGGNAYVPQSVQCTGDDNSTQCKGKEKGGGNNSWDARFYRK